MSKAYADMIAADGVIEDIRSMSAGERRLEVVQDVGGPSRTHQEFTDECDVNLIMERQRAAGAGQWPLPLNGVAPTYYDFTSMPHDLQGALNTVMEAEQAFMQLDASIRKTFDNDPLLFVEFASDSSNLEQMRKWGLATPEKVADAPLKVEVVSPPIQPGPSPQPSPAPGPAKS